MYYTYASVQRFLLYRNRRKMAWNEEDGTSIRQPVWRFSKNTEERVEDDGRRQPRMQDRITASRELSKDDPRSEARQRTFNIPRQTSADGDNALPDQHDNHRPNPGYFIVKRKIRSDTGSLDSRDNDFYSQNYNSSRPRRTEILYIRSPIRDDEFNRYPVPGMLPRSVSETALYNGANEQYDDVRFHQQSLFHNSRSTNEYHRRVRFPRYPTSNFINDMRNGAVGPFVDSVGHRARVLDEREAARDPLSQQEYNDFQQRAMFNSRHFAHSQSSSLPNRAHNHMNHVGAQFDNMQAHENRKNSYIYPERAHNNKVISDHYLELSGDSNELRDIAGTQSNSDCIPTRTSKYRGTEMQNECNENRVMQRVSVNLNTLNASTLESDLTSLRIDSDDNARTSNPNDSDVVLDLSPNFTSGQEQDGKRKIHDAVDDSDEIVVDSPHSNTTPIEHIQKHLTESDTPEIYENLKLRFQESVDVGTSQNESDEWKIHNQTQFHNHVFLHQSSEESVHRERPLVADQQDEDEDSDSGIGRGVGSLKLKKGNYLEKKSVFTIAYNGIQTRKLKSQDEKTCTP